MQDADRPNALSKSASLQKQISCDILEIPAATFFTNPIKILMRNLSRFIQNWSRMKNGYSFDSCASGLLITMADSHATARSEFINSYMPYIHVSDPKGHKILHFDLE
jgi:hypothetical protein